MKLSIITVTFNSLHTLKGAYASLCAQTFNQWEWVVQDGGSTDGTVAWLTSLIDPRIRIESNIDEGIYDALNKALIRTKGDWIGLLHSDDVYAHNEVLENINKATFENDAIYTDLQYVRASDTTKVLRNWRAGNFNIDLLKKGWMPPHPTVFLRKEIFTRVGPFDTQFKIASDYDYVLRVFTIDGIKVKYLPEVTVLMRQGGVSSNRKNLIKKSHEDLKIMKKNKLPLPWLALFLKITKKFNQLPN